MLYGKEHVERYRATNGYEGHIWQNGSMVALLTTKGRKENIIEGLEAGADDYLTKPFDPHELQVRLRAGKRIVTLQTELIEAREALRIQATHDPLTNIWNRRVIIETLTWLAMRFCVRPRTGCARPCGPMTRSDAMGARSS